MSIFTALFFAVGTIVFIILLIPGASYLRLTQESLQIRSLFRMTEIRWSQIKRFYVLDFGIKKMVAFDFSTNETPSGAKIISESKQKFRGPGALPHTYGMKAQELADLLNRFLQ